MTRSDYGVASMTGRLACVAMSRPSDALLQADREKWHYGPTHNARGILRDHAEFTELVRASGADVLWIESNHTGFADSVFPFDPSFMTPQGAILMRSGKILRQGEEEIHRAFYETNNIPVVGEISGEGRMDGGDCLWLTRDILAIGRGFRTNQTGIDQITGLLAPMGISVQAFDLPVFHGADACLHLLSLVSPVDTNKALVLTHLLPVALYQLMIDLNYDLIEAPLEEFDATGGISLNILATAPGDCIMAKGAPKTLALLEAAGMRVQTFSGEALCMACEGGPTCMTRPILRIG